MSREDVPAPRRAEPGDRQDSTSGSPGEDRSARDRRAGEGKDRDLGFGTIVSGQPKRLLNRDGTFNVERDGLSIWASMSAYHALIRWTWPRFIAALVVAYTAINLLFAFGYFACGPGGLEGEASGLGDGPLARFGSAFVFSVSTSSTVGYGHITPVGWVANSLMTVQTIVGLLFAALATGLIFARFARPHPRVLFSDHAVIAPYGKGEGTAFEFRIVNQRHSQLIEVQATVILALFDLDGDEPVRRYHRLELERDRVTFFPLTWTVVHPIDEDSPLDKRSHAELETRQAEFLVLLSAFDEASAQTVHTRTSYRIEEVERGARFTRILEYEADDATLHIDIQRLNETEALDSAPTAAPQQRTADATRPSKEAGS